MSDESTAVEVVSEGGFVGEGETAKAEGTEVPAVAPKKRGRPKNTATKEPKVKPTPRVRLAAGDRKNRAAAGALTQNEFDRVSAHVDSVPGLTVSHFVRLAILAALPQLS